MTVDVVGRSFTKIGAFQFSLRWDPAVLEYQSIQGFDHGGGGILFGFGPPINPGSINLDFVSSGRLAALWDHPFQDVSLPDGGRLFSVTFRAIGNVGAATSLELTDDPTSRAFASFSGDHPDFKSFPGQLEIIPDPDPPALLISVSQERISEGGTAIEVSVSRNSDPSEELWVNLGSSDTSEVTMPARVLIPRGALQASFFVSAVDDRVDDGDQAVTLMASAPGLLSGSRTIVVETRGPEAFLRYDSTRVEVDQEEDIDFGLVCLGSGVRTFTFEVRNEGEGELVLGTPSLPAGFSFREPLLSSLGAGEMGRLSVSLDSDVEGVKFGLVSIPTNERERRSFDFSIKGEVVVCDEMDCVEFRAGQIADRSGVEVHLPVTTRGFYGVSQVGFAINWDPGVAQFMGVDLDRVAEMTSAQFGKAMVEDGELSFVWRDASGEGLTLERDAVLFYIRFQLIGDVGASTAVHVGRDSGGLEAMDSGSEHEAVCRYDGCITVSGRKAVLPNGSAASMDASGTLHCSGEVDGNRAPHGVRDDLVRPVGMDPLKIRIAELLINDRDIDGDGVRFAGLASDLSIHGGSIKMLNSHWLVYYPDLAESGRVDYFEYDLTDGRGAYASALVSIRQEDSTLAVGAIEVTTPEGAGHSVMLSGRGVPGRYYQAQYTDKLNASAPIWVDLGGAALASPQHGGFEIVDSRAVAEQRIYRIVEALKRP